METTAEEKQQQLTVWEILRDSLGGEGWEGWTEAEIDRAMRGMGCEALGSGVDPHRYADELLEDAFDPRHIIPRHCEAAGFHVAVHVP